MFTADDRKGLSKSKRGIGKPNPVSKPDNEVKLGRTKELGRRDELSETKELFPSIREQLRILANAEERKNTSKDI